MLQGLGAADVDPTVHAAILEAAGVLSCTKSHQSASCLQSKGYGGFYELPGRQLSEGSSFEMAFSSANLSSIRCGELMKTGPCACQGLCLCSCQSVL